jgi:alpha-tubulin suppressor-like RCC1 family protein
MLSIKNFILSVALLLILFHNNALCRDYLISNESVIYTWGSNENGILGYGTNEGTTESSRLNIVDALNIQSIFQLSTMNKHSLLLNDNGKIYSWGSNSFGGLGDGTTGGESFDLLEIYNTGSLQNNVITQISAGNGYSLALDQNGKVHAWGRNDEGQLGNGDIDHVNTPIEVYNIGELQDKIIVQISTGLRHCLVLDQNGDMYSWGWNRLNQLGNISSIEQDYSTLPVKVNSDGNLKDELITQISTYGAHSLVLDTNGKVYSWGYNQYGQLGNSNIPNGGTYSSTNEPVLVDFSNLLAGEKIVQVSVGTWHSMMLSSNGNVYTFGSNGDGQLGRTDVSSGDTSHYTDSPSIIDTSDVLKDKIIVEIRAGESHSLVLDSDGKVYGWGSNANKKLSASSTTYFSTPIEIEHINNKNIKIVSIFAANEHSVAIASYGKDGGCNDDLAESEQFLESDGIYCEVTFNNNTLCKTEFNSIECYEKPQISPKVSPELSPQVSPEVSPELSPQVSPEVSPELSPQLSPELSPELSPQLSPEVSPELSPQVSLKLSPEVSPELSLETSPEISLNEFEKKECEDYYYGANCEIQINLNGDVMMDHNLDFEILNNNGIQLFLELNNTRSKEFEYNDYGLFIEWYEVIDTNNKVKYSLIKEPKIERNGSLFTIEPKSFPSLNNNYQFGLNITIENMMNNNYIHHIEKIVNFYVIERQLQLSINMKRYENNNNEKNDIYLNEKVNLISNVTDLDELDQVEIIYKWNCEKCSTDEINKIIGYNNSDHYLIIPENTFESSGEYEFELNVRKGNREINSTIILRYKKIEEFEFEFENYYIDIELQNEEATKLIDEKQILNHYNTTNLSSDLIGKELSINIKIEDFPFDMIPEPNEQSFELRLIFDNESPRVLQNYLGIDKTKNNFNFDIGFEYDFIQNGLHNYTFEFNIIIYNERINLKNRTHSFIKTSLNLKNNIGNLKYVSPFQFKFSNVTQSDFLQLFRSEKDSTRSYLDGIEFIFRGSFIEKNRDGSSVTQKQNKNVITNCGNGVKSIPICDGSFTQEGFLNSIYLDFKLNNELKHTYKFIVSNHDITIDPYTIIKFNNLLNETNDKYKLIQTFSSNIDQLNEEQGDIASQLLELLQTLLLENGEDNLNNLIIRKNQISAIQSITNISNNLKKLDQDVSTKVTNTIKSITSSNEERYLKRLKEEENDDILNEEEENDIENIVRNSISTTSNLFSKDEFSKLNRENLLNLQRCLSLIHLTSSKNEFDSFDESLKIKIRNNLSVNNRIFTNKNNIENDNKDIVIKMSDDNNFVLKKKLIQNLNENRVNKKFSIGSIQYRSSPHSISDPIQEYKKVNSLMSENINIKKSNRFSLIEFMKFIMQLNFDFLKTMRSKEDKNNGNNDNELNLSKKLNLPLTNTIELRTMIDGEYEKLSNLKNEEKIRYFSKLTDLTSNETQLINQISNKNISEILKEINNSENLETSNDKEYAKIICKYYNETNQDWQSDGCELISLAENEFECSCTHTTRFSSFLEYSQISPQSNSLQNQLIAIKISLNSFYFILSIFIFILLLVFRKNKLIKSRFITPYITLSAIIIESILVGVVSNSILLSSGDELKIDEFGNEFQSINEDLVNIWRNIGATISSALFSIILSLFFIQQLRYLFKRNLYELMLMFKKKDTKLEASNFMKFFKKLSSNRCVITSSLIISIFISSYFILWFLLVRFNVLSGRIYTLITTISYIIIFLSLSIGNLIIFGLDCYLLYTYDQLSTLISSNICNENNTDSIGSTLVKNNSNSSSNAYNVNDNSDSNFSPHLTSFSNSKKRRNGKNIFLSILNIKPIRILNHTFLVDDQLKFRIEIILYFLTTICLLVSYLIGFYTINEHYLKNNNLFVDYSINVSIIQTIFEFLFIIGCLLTFGGLFTIICLIFEKSKKIIKKLFKNKEIIAINNSSSDNENNDENEKEEEKEELFIILNNMFLYSLFQQFCKQEFSLENLYAISDLEKLKKTVSKMNVKNMIDFQYMELELSEFNDKFVQENAIYELNLSSSVKKSLRMLLDQFITNKLNVPKEKIIDVIDDLYLIVMGNLMDTIDRFIYTKEYKEYYKIIDLKDQAKY